MEGTHMTQTNKNRAPKCEYLAYQHRLQCPYAKSAECENRFNASKPGSTSAIKLFGLQQ